MSATDRIKFKRPEGLQSVSEHLILPGTMTTTLIEIEIEIRFKRPRRFKVQRRVDIFARDRSNKRFLFATTWHTVNEADRQATAERIFTNSRRDDRGHEFRIAEEWPIGSELRVIK